MIRKLEWVFFFSAGVCCVSVTARRGFDPSFVRHTNRGKPRVFSSRKPMLGHCGEIVQRTKSENKTNADGLRKANNQVQGFPTLSHHYSSSSMLLNQCCFEHFTNLGKTVSIQKSRQLSTSALIPWPEELTIIQYHGELCSFTKGFIHRINLNPT